MYYTWCWVAWFMICDDNDVILYMDILAYNYCTYKAMVAKHKFMTL